jgi:hypothetical protein
LSNQHFLRKIKPFTAEILVHQRTVDKTTNDQNWFLKARGNRGKPMVLQFAPHKQADTSQRWAWWGINYYRQARHSDSTAVVSDLEGSRAALRWLKLKTGPNAGLFSGEYHRTPGLHPKARRPGLIIQRDRNWHPCLSWEQMSRCSWRAGGGKQIEERGDKPIRRFLWQFPRALRVWGLHLAWGWVEGRTTWVALGIGSRPQRPKTEQVSMLRSAMALSALTSHCAIPGRPFV